MSLDADALQPAKILLVEDEPVQTILVKAALANLPRLDLMQVAKNGVEAMTFLRREAHRVNGQLPDLILLDINMPEKNGFEVLVELNSDPLLRRIPTVVFTTSNSQEDIDRAYEEGANSFVTKPVTLGDLERVLSRFDDYWVKTVRLPSRQVAKEAKRRFWRSAG